MSKKNWVKSIVSALLVMSATITTVAAAQPPDTEKCYGISKEGKHAFVYVFRGTCEKIVGGSLNPR